MSIIKWLIFYGFPKYHLSICPCSNFGKVHRQFYQGNYWGGLFDSWNNDYDDSGYNAIRLLCNSGDELVSAEGNEGEWTDWTFTQSNKSIVAVGIRSQRPHECYRWGECDDTATNGLRFWDSDGTIYYQYDYWDTHDAGGTKIYDNHNYPYVFYSHLRYDLDGYWASATCPAGKAITGFITQVQPDHR